MGAFDKFNQTMSEDYRKQIDEAKNNNGGNYAETPAGEYIVKIENMELKATKDGRPMLSVQMRLVEGCDPAAEDFLEPFKKKKPCIFMNRVVAGTKNDAAMIASVEGWLYKLDSNNPVTFDGNYDHLADDIMDLAEDVADLEMRVKYDPDKFNSVSIEEVFE